MQIDIGIDWWEDARVNRKKEEAVLRPRRIRGLLNVWFPQECNRRSKEMTTF
jgi:hypothetical protein